jgi:hypothetical protein
MIMAVVALAGTSLLVLPLSSSSAAAGFTAGALRAGFSADGSLCLDSLTAYGAELLGGPTPLWTLTAAACGGQVFPAGVAVDGCAARCAGAAHGAAAGGLELRWWGCALPPPVGGLGAAVNVTVQLSPVAAAPGEDSRGP